MPMERHSNRRHLLLRPATVDKRHCGWLISGVVALHLAIAAGIWWLSMPMSATSTSSPVILQLASVPAPAKPPAPTPPSISPSPPAPTRRAASSAPSKPDVASAPVRHRHNDRPVSKPTPSRPSPPPAGDMLGNALADIHQQGWQSTSQRYAEDSAGNVQSALARYRQDWVRAVQSYVDLHFPKTHRNAQLEFSVTVDRQGRLVGLVMVHSTGDAALDAQAFSAVRAAAPFRPFDAGMGNRQTLTFRQGWVFNQGALLEP